MRQRGARVTAILLGAASLSIHAQLLRSGGPLWRDEITTLHVASSSSWAATAKAMEFDSFPILPFVLLRAWTTLFGDSDVSLRGFGLAVGAAILAALWLAARA